MLGLVANALSNCLFPKEQGYIQLATGDLIYRGPRPGSGWHAHGLFSRKLWVLVGGQLQRRLLFKQRWYSPSLRLTVHSRPADELGRIHFCSLIVVAVLWPWLNDNEGVHRSTPAVADLCDGGPSSRTLQRWLHKALPHALTIQQAIRKAVIERCEPQPFEKLFPQGLSPPESMQRRRWREPHLVGCLWRALAILIIGSTRLKLPTTTLITEARKEVQLKT